MLCFKMAAKRGALDSVKMGLPESVDPVAVTRFSDLLAEAENANNPALLRTLNEAKAVLQEREVDDWIKEVEKGDNEADKKLVKELKELQERADRFYADWVKQQKEYQEQLERACEELLRRSARVS